MVNFIVQMIVGGCLGWLASVVTHTDREQAVLVNIVVGVAGAFIAELVSMPLFGMSPISRNNFSMPALLVALLGGISLLAVISTFRRGIRQQP